MPGQTDLPPAERVDRLLTDRHVPHRMVHHRASFTAAEEARAVGLPAEQTAKVVVLCDGAAFLAAIVPASDHLDLAKARAALDGTPGLRLAAEAEIRAHFPDYEAGAVAPVGSFARVVIDPRLLTYSRVLWPAGDHQNSAFADPEAIVRLTGARVADVVAVAG